jgi:hypothetical protein
VVGADPARRFVLLRVAEAGQGVEGRCWSLLAGVAQGRIPVARAGGASGVVVESYVHRGPEWKAGERVVKAGDWLLGIVWDEPDWPAVEEAASSGELPVEVGAGEEVPA